MIVTPEQPWLDIETQDTLDHLAAASTRDRVAIGTGFGQRNLTIKNPALERPTMDTKPFTDKHNGFSINCAVACQPHQRERLERLTRYITRPPLALERLSVNQAGQVVHELKKPFNDGTTQPLTPRSPRSKTNNHPAKRTKGKTNPQLQSHYPPHRLPGRSA